MTGQEVKTKMESLNLKIKKAYSTFEYKDLKHLIDEVDNLRAECPHFSKEGVCQYCGKPLGD